MATACQIALNLLKQDTTTKPGIKNKHKLCDWSDEYLFHVLGWSQNDHAFALVVGTAADEHVVTQAAAVLHVEETLAFGDAGYQGVVCNNAKGKKPFGSILSDGN